MNAATRAQTARRGEVPTEAQEYFAATIGDYRCRSCGTEFSINSLLFATRDLADGVECPICGTHADADALEFDPAADREVVAQ